MFLITNLITLLVAVLQCRIQDGPASAQLFGYLGNAVVRKFLFDAEPLLLRVEEVSRQRLLGSVRIFHGLAGGFGLSGSLDLLGTSSHDDALLNHTLTLLGCVCTVVEDITGIVEDSVDNLKSKY